MRRDLRLLGLLTSYVSLLTLLAGCRTSLSPVKNRIGVGVESYVFFDAEGEDGQGDIYVGSASGGKVFQVTFSRAHEFGPAISPDGVMLAFIRGPDAVDSTQYQLWVMNLLNGAERSFRIADGATWPEKVAWSPDGSRLLIATPRGTYTVPAPPAQGDPTQADAATATLADTLFSVPLGNPVMALAGSCDSGDGICAVTTGGSSQVLSQAGRAPLRWGADSIGYFVGDLLEVRPLGGGTTRQLRWAGMPANTRSATHFPGRPVQSSEP